MDIKIAPRKLGGRVSVISSKSAGHRALIAAALSKEKTQIEINTLSNDIKATASCLEALGAKLVFSEGKIEVEPIVKVPENVKLNCLESGSTLRFILPVAACLCESFEITGEGRLPERPMNELIDEMEKHGCVFSSKKLPFKVCGKMKGGRFELPGNVSSQYITGLLLALPLLDEESEIVLTSALESSGYVDMTLQTLGSFEVNIEKKENSYYISENCEYHSNKTVKIEGDWSNAAFFLAADYLCGGVTVDGLSQDSLQKDKAFSDILPKLKDGAVVDAGEIPDIILPLCVCAAKTDGVVTFTNAKRLRLKESDRLFAAKEMINSLGGKAEISDDEIKVFGNGRLTGGVVDGFNDHRVVMSAAIASCICEKDVIIKGAQAVNKSYPNFFEEFEKLGGNIDVFNVWE